MGPNVAGRKNAMASATSVGDEIRFDCLCYFNVVA